MRLLVVQRLGRGTDWIKSRSLDLILGLAVGECLGLEAVEIVLVLEVLISIRDARAPIKVLM